MGGMVNLGAQRGDTAVLILEPHLILAKVFTSCRAAARVLDVPTMLSVKVKRAMAKDPNVRPMLLRCWERLKYLTSLHGLRYRVLQVE